MLKIGANSKINNQIFNKETQKGKKTKHISKIEKKSNTKIYHSALTNECITQ